MNYFRVFWFSLWNNNLKVLDIIGIYLLNARESVLDSSRVLGRALYIFFFRKFNFSSRKIELSTIQKPWFTRNGVYD